MVLAAGLGSRLRPLTDSMPKPLVPVLNRPLLVCNLLLLREAGIREVIINLHYRGHLLREALGDGHQLDMDLRYSQETELMGTGGGVRRVLPWLAERGTFLVLNGDTLVDVDLRAALARHHQRGAQGTMLLHAHQEAAAAGAIGLDDEGLVNGIGPLLGPRPDSPYLFAGVHILEPQLIERIPERGPACIIREAYCPAIREGAPVHGDPSVRYWADLGTPQRYLRAHLELLENPRLCRHAIPQRARPEQDSPDGAVAGGLTRVEPVLLGDGVRVEGAAEVGPGVVIGPDSVLAAGARVRRSVVWPGARVEGDLQDAIALPDGRVVQTAPEAAPAVAHAASPTPALDAAAP